MCTYEHLVAATLPHGLSPLVVPQLRTITLGGAVTGLGIESASFRNGLPHESVLEMDILTGAGDVVTARPEGEHADLFRGFPNSYGTLGYATRLRIQLEPVHPFVELRHVRFHTIEALVEALARIVAAREHQTASGSTTSTGSCSAPPSPTSPSGARAPSRGRPATTPGMAVYYRSLQHAGAEPKRDRLTIHDYLWRWDTDWFWCSRAFGAQDRRLRRLWPRRWRRSSVYWKLVALDQRWSVVDRLEARRGRPPRERVVQDVEIPVGDCADVPALVPARDPDRANLALPAADPRRRAGRTGPRSTPLAAVPPARRRDLRQRGLLVQRAGRPPASPGAANRLIEQRGDRPPRPQVALLRLLLRPCRVRPPLRRRRLRASSRRATTPRPDSSTSTPRRCSAGDRSQADPDAPGGTPAGSAWPRSSRPSPTGRSPLRFTAFDGSAAGPQDAACGLHLQQPARARPTSPPRPGDLGLARAYVAGDLDLVGAHPADPYPVLAAMADDAVPGAAAPHPRRRVRGPSAPDLLRPPPPPAAGGPAPLASRGGGPAALQDPRRRGHPPPLRRVQRLLRARARPVDDLHLRHLPARGRYARGGPGEQVPPGLRQAPAQGGRPAARHRLRLGRDGAVCRAAGCARHRRHPVARSRRPGPRPRSSARGSGTSPRCGSRTTATCPRGGSTPSPRSGSPSTSGCGTTRHTSAASGTGCGSVACCSTTASPGPTTACAPPAPSSTATSSPTAS